MAGGGEEEQMIRLTRVESGVVGVTGVGWILKIGGKRERERGRSQWGGERK